MIKKPQFYRHLLSGIDTKEPVITEQDFDLWLKSLLSEAVEVNGWLEPKEDNWWRAGKVSSPTAKALLINIQPIKKETCAERCRNILIKMKHKGRFTEDDLILVDQVLDDWEREG
jgi:hypothetical protein